MNRTASVLFSFVIACIAAAPLAAQCPSPSFQELEPSPAGHDVTDWAIGDFDGDGDNDVISVAAATRTVKIGLNDGEGTYTESFSTTTFYVPGTIAVGDFNEDQRLDFVVAQEKSGPEDTCTLCGRFQIYLQEASGLFQAGATYVLPYASGIRRFAVADFNDDGHLDLAIAAPPLAGATQNLNLTNGTGSGSFVSVQSWTIDGTIADIIAGDFASPAGLPDLVVAHGPGTASTKSRVSTLRNLTGTFDGTYTSFDLGSTGTTMHLDAGHYSADAWLDVAVTVTGYTTPQIQTPMNGARVLFSNSGGGFTSAGGLFRTDVGLPTDVAAVDITQDGRLDLVFVTGTSTWYALRASSTTGALEIVQEFITRPATVPVAGVAETDFDRDGRPDLLFLDTPDDLYVPAHNACFWHATGLTLTKTPDTFSTTFGQPVTLTATLVLNPDAPLPQNGSVSFYDGATLLQTVPLDANGVASYTTSSLALGSHTLRAVFNASDGEPYPSVEKSTSHHVDPPPFGPPLFVTATGNSGNNTITITWTNTQEVASSEVFRMTNGQWVSIGTTTNTFFSDPGRDPSQVYVYTVRSYRTTTNEASGFGNADVATTASTALPLDRTIRASHINELRTLVNSLRAAVGFAPIAFTDPTLTAGIPIKAAHINELRMALADARGVLGLAPVSYTQPAITAGVTPVLLADLQEIKAAMY
ncbi:MAG TPA: FG-GAP-like repeat-containing protein [Thermoanaerobaculia bacterium]|nr:FG-GAP-like repeat-containing protein [Thermoanaerobaculia bacterium]